MHYPLLIIKLQLRSLLSLINISLEGKKNISWDDIKDSRLSNALILLKESQEETEKLLQRAKKAVENFKLEQDKRNDLTYNSTEEMELNIAKTSIERAKQFRTIVLEYLQTKR